MGQRIAMIVALAALAGCQVAFGLDEVKGKDPSPRALVLDNRQSATDLAGLPVLVALDPTVVDYTRITDPATDLRFADGSTGRDLAFEIDHWDPAGESDVWVLAPTLPARSMTRLLMYFGPDAGGHADAAATWRDFALVFHGDQLADSANPADTPMLVADPITNTAPALEPAVVGRGPSFAGLAGQHIEFPGAASVFSGWPTFTVELWVYLDYPVGTALQTEPSVFDKWYSAAHNSRIRNAALHEASPLILQTDFTFAADSPYEIIYVPNQTWFHLAYSYDGQTVWTYRDGVVIDVNANPSPEPAAVETMDPFRLASNEPLLGAIDELRVSPAYRSPDWMYAEHLAMTGHLVTFEDP